MRLYVGVTDHEWFAHLIRRQATEANFWQPSGPRFVHGLQRSELFLFKLKKAQGGLIVGGGHFVDSWPMEPEFAWDVFERDNGVEDKLEFLDRLGALAPNRDPARRIGCNLLEELFVLPEPFEPPEWSPSIVQGKGYDTGRGAGAAIYEAVRTQLGTVGTFTRERGRVPQGFHLYDEVAIGEIRPMRTRVGQGEFRIRTLENYRYTCCVTGEHTVPALEAAHILPVAEEGRHRLSNGLCLRADIHRLFDRGLIGITPEHGVLVSPLIRDLYLNGRPYYALEGKQLSQLPDERENWPDRQALARHTETIFRRS